MNGWGCVIRPCPYMDQCAEMGEALGIERAEIILPASPVRIRLDFTKVQPPDANEDMLCFD